jgi:hypothetical protein
MGLPAMRHSLAATFFGLLLAASTVPAQATPSPSVTFSLLQSGSTLTSVTGNATDLLSIMGNYGGFAVSFGATGYAGAVPELSLGGQLQYNGTSGMPLVLALTETNLPAVGGTVLTLESDFTAIMRTASVSSYISYQDNSNTAFGMSKSLSSFSAQGPGAYSFGPADVVVGASGLYSISEYITFNPVAGAHPTLDGTLTANVPEPASFAMFGVGALGLAAVMRRRRAA